MNTLTATLNNMYSGFKSGLNDFEQKTDNLVNYLDQKAASLRENYNNIKGMYGTVRQDVEEACETVNRVCKKLDDVYKNTMGVFMHGLGVADSVIKKVKGIFFPWKKKTKIVPTKIVPGTPNYQQAVKQPVIQQPKEKTPRGTYESEKKQESAQTPVVTETIEKTKQNITLDKIVKDFKKRVAKYNPGYEVGVDVYKNGQIFKSYALSDEQYEEPAEANTELEQTQTNENRKRVFETEEREKSYLESLLERADKRFVDYSVGVTKLYNSGYKTKEIIRELTKKGYTGASNFNDITDMVAVGLRAGLDYNKGKYNNAIAAKLGARDQVIHDYLSGNSYKEIKQNLKKNTNGMNISDSSILRIMHGYEKKTGKKVVGKRNGNGKRKGKNSVRRDGGKKKEKNSVRKNGKK